MKDNDLNKENVIKITDSEFENGEMDIDMMLDSVFLGLEYVNKTRPMSVPRLFTEAIPSDIAQKLDEVVLKCYYDDNSPSPFLEVSSKEIKRSQFTKMVVILDKLPSTFSHTELTQAGASLGMSTSTCERLIKRAIFLEYATKQDRMYFKTTKK
ncbi:MAG: hypothetical protein ACK5KV_10495 [Bacteroides graminisolvens]|jgi:hypothetical protein|uniref:hypothetical protein n=1 Tax=Bacteroides graminisolvens TaxID=477666 RepID=UPI003A8A0AED